MATKKTNSNTNSKKPGNNQKTKVSSLLGFLRRRWWVVLLVGLLVFGFSTFAYEKYLDRQNVADMKQLVVDFEQLKTDVEAETGEQLFIESSCDSVGKFSESYACIAKLKPSTNEWNNILSDAVMDYETPHLTEFGDCQMLSENSSGFDSSEDIYICSFRVRSSNISSAKKIFY